MNNSLYSKFILMITLPVLGASSVYGGSLIPTLYPLNNSVTGFAVSSNSLYVSLSGAGDDFFTAFVADGQGNFSPGAVPNTPTGSSVYNPTGPMVAGGTALYGTGSAGNGCIFTVNTDGSGFAVLHSFSGTDGANPSGGLILSSNYVFGTTSAGGTNGDGTVFAMDTSGHFASLWSFTGTDGSSPVGGVVLSGDTLYGTTSGGDTSGDGTIFAIHIDGSGFTNLYKFSGNDGSNPQSGLFLAGNTLYGTTSSGGTSGDGTVFAIQTDGAGFKTLHDFKGSDGSDPQCAPLLVGTSLYGVTPTSTAGTCTIFSLSTSGQNFTVLHSGFVNGLTGGFTPMPQGNGTLLLTAGNNPNVAVPAVAAFLAPGALAGPGQLAIDTSSLPEGTNDVTYSQSLTASGGQAAYVWKLASGTLPRGLTLSSTGLLSGKPTAGGTYNFTVEVTDAAKSTATESLTLEIFVPDLTPPTITVTSPKTGAATSNNVFVVTGTAKDNVAVANVLVSVNDSDWASATPLDGWTNWNYSAGLTAGTNTISIFAVDTSDNQSTVDTVKLFYTVADTLVVETNGDGSITKDYNGEKLDVGENYSMTAKAATGFRFVDWTDGQNDLLTTNATLKFTMAPGLEFIAHFVDVTKPTLSITSPKAGAKVTGTTITVTGKAADNVGVAGVWYQLNSGAWSEASGLTNWTVVNLPVVSGSNTLKAYATDAAGNISTTNSVTFTDTP